MEFSNPLILPEEIPAIEVVVYQELEKKYLKVMRIQFFIIAIVLGLGMAVAFYFIEEIQYWWAILGIVAVYLLFFVGYWVVDGLNFRYSGYAIRKHDLLFKSGWWIHRISIVPFNRVQHLSIESGMIERRFGLASIHVYTSGSSQADCEVYGLKESSAHEIKEWIASQNTKNETIIE